MALFFLRFFRPYLRRRSVGDTFHDWRSGMTRFEALTKKADGLIDAASNCKTESARGMLKRFADAIIGVRDSMTVEEAMAE